MGATDIVHTPEVAAWRVEFAEACRQFLWAADGYRALGLLPVEAAGWANHGFAPNEVAPWLAEGHTPERASFWANQYTISPADARKRDMA